MFALYLTIWIALALFAIGETGRSLPIFKRAPPAWAWWAFSLGLALAIFHTLLAFDLVHNWVHASAVRSTAMQTEAVFGLSVGWGVYVNYVFFIVWLLDAWAWRTRRQLPAKLTWILRAFYMVMIVNGAVIFAAGARRLLGSAIVTWLAVAWVVSPAPPAPHRR
jgi:hypothetical protein